MPLGLAHNVPMIRRLGFCTLLAAVLVLSTLPLAWSQEESGEASYYSDDFTGRKTASGEVYDPTLLTAAHKSLRFGIRLQVINQDNGRSVVVTVNDRGPFVKGRIIDLSRAAAEALGLVETGTARVSIRALKAGDAGESMPPPPLVYFQLGAFRTQANAMTQARNLLAQGFQPRIRQEGTLFRVFVSASEGGEAEALLATLAQAKLSGYLQTSREPAGTDLRLPTN
jgi:rare lipoprotein A